jgi:hypothetical protein
MFPPRATPDLLEMIGRVARRHSNVGRGRRATKRGEQVSRILVTEIRRSHAHDRQRARHACGQQIPSDSHERRRSTLLDCRASQAELVGDGCRLLARHEDAIEGTTARNALENPFCV